MAIFNSYVGHYQRVNPIPNPIKTPFSYGFPMLSLWVSYGFPFVSPASWKTFSSASSAAQLKPRWMASCEVSMAKHTEGTKGLRRAGTWETQCVRAMMPWLGRMN